VEPVKVRVDSALCVGHGRCYEISPEVFGDDERGHCVVLRETVPSQHEAATRRAEANCPERAITLEES
jgi:ferredoxin